MGTMNKNFLCLFSEQVREERTRTSKPGTRLTVLGRMGGRKRGVKEKKRGTWDSTRLEHVTIANCTVPASTMEEV